MKTPSQCQVVKVLSPARKSAITNAERTENTRNLIALVFIVSYLALLIFLILLSSFFGLEKESAKDYLLAIGTPLGFIIGYYFKISSTK
jgi:hypothetical protein